MSSSVVASGRRRAPFTTPSHPAEIRSTPKLLQVYEYHDARHFSDALADLMEYSESRVLNEGQIAGGLVMAADFIAMAFAHRPEPEATWWSHFAAWISESINTQRSGTDVGTALHTVMSDQRFDQARRMLESIHVQAAETAETQ